MVHIIVPFLFINNASEYLHKYNVIEQLLLNKKGRLIYEDSRKCTFD